MFRKLSQYLTALLTLCVIATAYQVVVVAYLRPANVERMKIMPRTELRADDTLSDLFPDDAWQRGTCKRLQTRDGMLLFENWEQASADQWRLWPITIVIGRGMDGDASDSPMIIEAAEGAEIKFAGSLDMMSGGAPPIERGRVLGVVEIRRIEPAEADDSLFIRTANVGIDNQKIWTTEAIQMNMGQARMVGRDLTIHLATTTSAPMLGQAKSAVLDRMELIYLEELTIPLANGGLWPAITTQTPATNNNHATTVEPAMVSIECGGRLEYDFAINQLVLRESVSFTHKMMGAPVDRFDCDTISLTLRDPTNEAISRAGALDWITRIQATGAPLVAKLPNLDLEIAAGQLDLNATRGLVRADGKQGIEIRRGPVHARLESLIYQYDPAAPETLGAIDARGIGIVQLADSDLPIRRARWKEGFKLQPVAAATIAEMTSDIHFWIDGEVSAVLSDGGEFHANSVQGVLKPVRPERDSEQGDAAESHYATGSPYAAGRQSDSPMAAENANSQNAALDSRAPRQEERMRLTPSELAATGNVRLDTASIEAITDRLRLFFVQPRETDSEQSDESNAGKANSIRQLVTQPDSSGPATVPVARSRPTIQGDSISAQLLLSKSGVTAKDLSVAGSIRLTHSIELGGQPMLAKLTGEQLRLIDGGGDDVLQLSSGINTPARFELGDGYFVGPMIQIRPSDNVIWINQAGEFQIPTQALPAGLPTGESGEVSNLRWTKPPRCRWQGEMIFDGKTAVLSDGIRLNASLINGSQPWDFQIDGDRMEVLLNEGVQVRDLKTMRNATIQRIDLTQNDSQPLIVQATQYGADGLTESKHRLHSKKLTLLPAGDGKLYGSGPGWYRYWSRSQLEGGAVAKNADNGSGERSLTAVHLVFQEAMQGDMTHKRLDFLRGVRVGIQQVTQWEQTFDAQAMNALSDGHSTLDCDQLRVSVAPEGVGGTPIPAMATAWETDAMGGVVFRTRNNRGLLECTASRAAYASGKDLFTMHGVPNRPAIFRQTSADGQPAMEAGFRTVTLKLKSMQIVDSVLERLNIAAPPGSVTR